MPRPAKPTAKPTAPGTTLPQVPAEDKPISPEEFTQILSKMARDYLPELFGKDIALAMGNSRESAKARQDLYDRLVGKPSQTVQNTTPMQLTIRIDRVDTRDAVAEPAVDGVVRLLEPAANSSEIGPQKP